MERLFGGQFGDHADVTGRAADQELAAVHLDKSDEALFAERDGFQHLQTLLGLADRQPAENALFCRHRSGWGDNRLADGRVLGLGVGRLRSGRLCGRDLDCLCGVARFIVAEE